MKKVFLIIFAFLLYANLNILADGISVKSFKLLENDNTARSEGTLKREETRKLTALVKIKTNERGIIFANTPYNVAIEEKEDEIWLYVPESSLELLIFHPTYGVYDYRYPVYINQGHTYEMQLDSPLSNTDTSDNNQEPSKEEDPAIKIKTEIKDGFTVEYYDNNGKKYEIWRKANGDFCLLNNYNNKWASYCHFTLSDGTVVDGNNDFQIKGGHDKEGGTNLKNFVGTKVKFPNGNYYLSSCAHFGWFKDPKTTCKELLSYNHDNNRLYYVYANKPNKFIPFDDGSKSGDITIDNNVYHMNSEDGNLIQYKSKLDYIKDQEKLKKNVSSFYDAHAEQIVRLPEDIQEKLLTVIANYYKKQYTETFELPIASQDSVTNYEYDRDQKIFKINYANGDEVIIDDSYHAIKNGTHIHRNNGVLEYKNDQVYLSLKDGRKFRAYNNYYHAFKEVDNNIFGKEILANNTLTPWNGLMINKDNTGKEISEGLTQEERDAERKKAEAEKAKEDRENYNYLCKRFGKTYVDKALKGQVVIGMPELLFVATFKPTLKQQSGNRKLYYVYGWGTYDSSSKMTITNNQLKKKVWITNGKVSSIQIINN